MQKEKIIFIKGKRKCNLNKVDRELKSGFYIIHKIIPQNVNKSKVYGGFIVHLVRVN